MQSFATSNPFYTARIVFLECNYSENQSTQNPRKTFQPPGRVSTEILVTTVASFSNFTSAWSSSYS